MKTHFNTIIIALAIVISTGFLSRAWVRSHERKSSMNVTGLAARDFVSDLIVWRGSYTTRALTLKETYAELKKDAEAIRLYLISKGLKEQDMIFSAVDISREYERSRDKNDNEKETFVGYALKQNVQIESKEVDKIESISRQVTELIDSGVELYSEAPRYYYTKLAELKIEMLASASKDAKDRAEKIAENAGGSIGDLNYADMGVFQITAPNSTEEYSWGGTLNTTSKRKTASITVKLEFSIN